MEFEYIDWNFNSIQQLNSNSSDKDNHNWFMWAWPKLSQQQKHIQTTPTMMKDGGTTTKWKF
jgi:hypothetical protein